MTLLGLAMLSLMVACPNNKRFVVVDPEPITTDTEAVEMASDALAIGFATGESAASVSNDITLPTSGDDGVAISWASSDTNVISTTGVVTRPGDDTLVTLTATLTKSNASAMKVFMLTVIGTIPKVTEGVARIFADAEAVTNVPLAALSRGTDENAPTFAFVGDPGIIELNFTNAPAAGANSSEDYLIIPITGNPPWSGFGWRLAQSHDVLTTDNLALKFYLRSTSTSGDLNIEFEDGTGNSKSGQVTRSYIADNTWQEITIPVSEFTGGSGFDLADGVKNLVFVTGAGNREIEIDEVQFAVLSGDAVAVINVRDALAIGFAAGESATSVSNDVTLPISDNGVAISWASSDANVITANGRVTRADLSASVTLTATLTKGEARATKVFLLRVIGTIPTVTEGTARIYADAEAVTNVPVVPLLDARGRGFAGRPDCSGTQDELLLATETTTGTDGANSSANYVTISPSTANACWGGYIWEFDSYDATATNVNLKFSVRSTDANVNSILVKLERPGEEAAATAGVEMTFTADGNWQELTYPLNETTFTGAGSAAILADLGKVVFVLSDVNGEAPGIGDQSLSIDEVQFVVPSPEEIAVINAKNALGIGFAAGDRATSVRNDVSLPTNDNGLSLLGTLVTRMS